MQRSSRGESYSSSSDSSSGNAGWRNLACIAENTDRQRNHPSTSQVHSLVSAPYPV